MRAEWRTREKLDALRREVLSAALSREETLSELISAGRCDEEQDSEKLLERVTALEATLVRTSDRAQDLSAALSRALLRIEVLEGRLGIHGDPGASE